jgi:hypothetical protein
MLAKQHNLNLFRETCASSADLPRELFSFEEATPCQAAESQALKVAIAWPPRSASYDLATELGRVYPGIPWICDYFVISTFPATFGHFIGQEYLTHGLTFIQSHIADPLAPRLVGTFLLHAFVFRDRLMESFTRDSAGAIHRNSSLSRGVEMIDSLLSDSGPFRGQRHFRIPEDQ